MKYIFRTALLNRFAIEPVVSRSDLGEALKRVKYPTEDLEHTLEKWNAVVDDLVKAGERQEDKIALIINQGYPESLDEEDIKDITTIWLNEYEQVYSAKFKGILPYNHLQGLEWSVNTTFMSKKMDKMSESVAILNLRLQQQDGKQKMVTFEMGREDLMKFYGQLANIEQKVDQLIGAQ